MERDIDGMACGIELYIVKAALSANGELRPVQWKGTVAGAWQGEVAEKEALRGRF